MENMSYIVYTLKALSSKMDLFDEAQKKKTLFSKKSQILAQWSIKPLPNLQGV